MQSYISVLPTETQFSSFFHHIKDVSTPRERVETISETLHRPSTVDDIANWACVDVDTAEEIVTELVAEGILYEFDEMRYAVSEGWVFASEIRKMGEETDERVLIPNDILDKLESGDDIRHSE